MVVSEATIRPNPIPTSNLYTACMTIIAAAENRSLASVSREKVNDFWRRVCALEEAGNG